MTITTTLKPGAIWPDGNGIHINAHGGGMLYHEGVYYWFGEHKIEGPAGNLAHVGVHCYSSRDLYNWVDEGIALSVADEPGHPIERGCVLERPKVIFNARTGKFVMWFHLELKDKGYSAALSGVAVSDRVTGPYTFLNAFRPDAGIWPTNVTEEDKIPADSNYLARDWAGGQMARDMTLFVDDDGQGYHFYSSEENRTTHVSLLSDDYLRPSGRYARIFANREMEAPSVFKHDGRYYFIGSSCTGWAPNAARSAVADSIWGPWTELGNPCIGTEEQVNITFESQSTYILPVEGKPGAFIFMADRWRPENAIDGRYIWLPIQFEEGRPVLRWMDEWDLSFLDSHEAISVIQLDSPMDYQVFQRETLSAGAIHFAGKAIPECDAVGVTLSGKSMQGDLSGESQSLNYDCATGQFSADIPTPAGGWYSATVHLKKKGAILATATVAHIGVGEVFIVSGQSNATNHGDTHQYPTSGMVSAFSGSEWRIANDPQPGNQDGSTGGSFIPAFGDALHATWRVPIGIASVGYGGTSVRQWLPKGEKIYVQPSADICCKQIGPDLWESEGFLYAGMMERINLIGPNGFRALLWHQGESDCDQAPDRQIEYEDYKAMTIHIIRSTQKEAGWAFPWMVAQVSYHSPESPITPEIRQMQAEIWNEGIALEGPDTDILDGDNRDFSGLGVHLSAKGLENHGRMWAEKVSSHLESILT